MPAPTDPRRHAQELLDFVAASPSPYHAAAAAEARLTGAGFRRLEEEDRWEIERGGTYYTVRNGSSVIAFVAGTAPPEAAGYRIVGTHLDSPALKLKPQPVIERHGYVQLGVEVYGGALLNSWLDRDLGLAGRVMVTDEPRGRGVVARESRPAARKAASRAPRAGRGTGRRGGTEAAARSAAAPTPAAAVRSLLFRFDAPLARIPQLAIHLDREVNDKGLVLNKENHLVPVIGLSGSSPFDFPEWLASQLGVPAGRILDHDLLLFDRVAPSFLGLDAAFISAPRLDNLASSHAALAGLLEGAGERAAATRVAALYDNEEIGSSTRQGASGSFLGEILDRVTAALGADDPQTRHRARAHSFLVSSDMAHAVHPNYPDRSEPRHAPLLNGGPVIKYNANARYATDSVSGARFAALCREARVPFQRYVNRADLACGSTIGPIVSTQLGLRTVDVGSPMLAMHSAREMAGADDPGFMVRALRHFYLS